MKRSARGMTLIELMVSTAILAVVITMAFALLLLAVRANRSAESTTDTTEAARFAGDVLADALGMAGMGAGGRLYVYDGTAIRETSAVIGVNNTSAGDAIAGTDEVWVVVPHRNAFQQSCSSDALDLGAGTMVQSWGGGTFNIRCKDSLDDPSISKAMMMVSNMNTAAIISNVGFQPLTPGPGYTVTFTESSVANFSDAPAHGGYQVGDLLFPASVKRYFVGPDPRTNLPSLMVQTAVPRTSGGSASANPFQVTTPAQISVVQENIEDLQLAFGVDPTNGADPANVVWANNANFGPAYTAGLRSLRISVVAKSSSEYRDQSGALLQSSDYQARPQVEDHGVSLLPDGYRRILYTRRVEVPNMASANL